MGQPRNKKTRAVVEPTLTSILNSVSTPSEIEKGSRKSNTVEENGNDNGSGRAPLKDINLTRLRSRGKKSGKENTVETEADGANPSTNRRSRRLQSKNVQGILRDENKENASSCGKPISSPAIKRKRATKTRSDVEGSQEKRSKRNRVAKSSTGKKDNACLREQLGKKCKIKGAGGPPYRPLSPGTGVDAVETCSNSVPSTPAVNVTPDVHYISDDDENPNAWVMKDKSLHKCHDNDDKYDDEDAAIAIAKMHETYAKLHAKYKKLKERKLEGIEAYIGQQSEKFCRYMSAAEGLLEHLRNDNNWLRSEDNDYAVLNRVRLLERENAECQSDLLVERSKNLVLLKEVKRLGQLLSDQQNKNKQVQNTNQLCQDASAQSFSLSGKSVVLQPERHEATGLQGLSKNCTSRFKKGMVQIEMTQNTCDNVCPESGITLDESDNRQICKKSARGTASNFSQADLCAPTQRNKTVSDDALKGDSRNVGCAKENSLFRMLLQCVLGLQFSILNERDEFQVLVLHESSGFSFTLKCLSAEDDSKLTENGWVLYRSVSLGTLQRIAPDWMKEEIVFRMGLVNLFFDKILQVAKGRRNNISSR